MVAGEVRLLAQHTEARTKEIKTVLDSLATELAPAHEALQTSRKLVDSTAHGVRSVSVPILDRGGRARFALAVRATPEVIPEAKIPWVLSQARACVAAIQVHLLFPEDRPAQPD